MEHAAFYEATGDGQFRSTPATAGPWDAGHQHAGPPSALIARGFQRHDPVPGQQLATVAVDILRPVPVAPLTVRVRTVRPGRRIMLLEAEVTAQGQPVLRARGWRIARSAVPVATAPGGDAVPAVPGAGWRDAEPVRAGGDGRDGDPGWQDGDGRDGDPGRAGGDGRDGDGDLVWPGAHRAGYLAAMDWRFVTGGFVVPGPAQAWLRPRVPLVAGEETSPACRVMLAADSGNGISGELDPARWLFVNVDLTVALHREPAGEWVLLDAVTTVGPDGVGLATSRLADRDGTVGRGMQTLVVTPRR